jgi:DnaJ-class molecular chaperone
MSGEQRDLYRILGVDMNATPDEISSAYRSLLRHHHPDTRSGGHDSAAVSDAALQDVIAAYRVLHDPGTRDAYDKRRRPRRRVTVAPPPASFDGATSSSGAEPPLRAGPVRWQRTRD